MEKDEDLIEWAEQEIKHYKDFIKLIKKNENSKQMSNS